MSHMGRRLALEGWPEGQAKVDMEEGTEEGGRRVEVPGTLFMLSLFKINIT